MLHTVVEPLPNRRFNMSMQLNHFWVSIIHGGTTLNKIWVTVDLVIFACVDFREFVILGLFT